MDKEALYQIIQEDQLLVVARGTLKNPSIDIRGKKQQRIMASPSAVQVHQFALWFDAASNAVELCINPQEHRASYAYEQINALEKRLVCKDCQALRTDYLRTKVNEPPLRVYDFSDKVTS